MRRHRELFALSVGPQAGEPPPCLFDYLPNNALLVIDESHQTIPQLGAMYKGDRSRKETLVEYGFRLPSALDNRPLRFEEFEQLAPQAIYVSATPGPYEKRVSGADRRAGRAPDGPDRSGGRRSGRCGPRSTICCRKSACASQANERVLVTTLTKRMAEDLTEYLNEHGVKVRYLHADIETVERSEIIRDLRLGKFDVIVGINLLREGLDMPEVSLVAILDADKEGFLRSEGSLIQTIGRAARNVQGKAILYADIEHRLDRARHRRDRPAPQQADRVQCRARHHAPQHRQGGGRCDGGRASGPGRRSGPARRCCAGPGAGTGSEANQEARSGNDETCA